MALAPALVLAMAEALRAETVIPSPYWRNTISFPDDDLRSQGPSQNEPGWIKFTQFVSDPSEVYFQDSNQYPFHYDFATDLVVEYQGMSPSQYDQITLYKQGQQAILGAVILPHWTQSTPPAEAIQEYGIQFVRQDPYDPAEVVTLFNLVRASVLADPGVQAFYFPSYEQIASAEQNRDYFASHGIIVSSAARWASGNSCYSQGWALGDLKYFPGDQIRNAYLSGQLRPGDILLTDGVPAEVPIVAGILTLSASTPSSHVAILARTYGIPFVFLALTDDAARAQQLVGHTIALRAYDTAGACQVRLIDVDGVLTQTQIDEILALKAPQALNISPVAACGAWSAPTDGMVPADIQYFGGKAANFGFLRRAIPDSSPVSLAFSFDLWNAFLDQALAGGNTLRDEIAARLAGFTYPPADMMALANVLDDIRDDLFKNTGATHFSQALEDAVIDALQDPQYGFDPNRKIRFRSSTNVEDSEQFTGAGLYDSFSGCLADDLDDDAIGPSLCDPTEKNERGVFRAIRRVFASFYNDNAYLERLRHGISEDQVGMALLVHHSFPDDIELANGVATLERSSPSSRKITLVTQDGAVSVTNPTDGSIPEEVSVSVWSFGTYLTLVRYSNLVPMGATVMEWEQDYRDLADLLVAVAEGFETHTGKTQYVLDFEYKKVAPDGDLVVKQVREIARPDTTPSITPFMINEPTEYCTFQGEYGNVFANHRLKTRWLIATASTWLDAEHLSESVYAGELFEYTVDGHIRSLAGPPSLWPSATYAVEGTTTTDSWTVSDCENPRACRVVTQRVGVLVAPSESPLVTIRDLGLQSAFGAGYLELTADYAKEVPSIDWEGPIITTTDEAVLLPCFPEQSGDQLQERTLLGPKGEQITTRFYWPPEPGWAAGYTAPLTRWVETQIQGYTSQPIVLQGYYSQTYRPEHHNFAEHFIFEPRLEPGAPAALLDELRARDIRLIHVRYDAGSGQSTFTTYGFLIPGDFDHDGDVDMDDLRHLEACATGPAVAPPLPGCWDADLDGDADVDQSDFGLFQSHFTGRVQSR